MQERDFIAEGLIIRSRDFGDNDKIVTVLSRDFGKFSAIAKGVRKQKSSLRGSVMPFSHSKLAVTKGRGSLFVITQGEVQNPFLSLSSELEKIAYSAYLCELLDIGVPEHKPMPDVFLLALACFSILDLHDELRLAARLFELRFLGYMGLKPHLDGCMLCGRKVYNTAFTLSAMRGGVVCEPCLGRNERLISAGTVQIMKQLLTADFTRLLNLKLSEDNYRELYTAIIPYLDYQLEYSARARKFLNILQDES